jgi:hypothetical protein
MKVEIIGGDHQNKPDIGLSIARQWFDVDKVDAIADVPTSSVALAVNELTRDKNKVFLAVGPATSDLTGKACSPPRASSGRQRLARRHGGAATFPRQLTCNRRVSHFCTDRFKQRLNPALRDATCDEDDAA